MKYDAATITSLYLFGQPIPPKGDELLNDQWISRNKIERLTWSNEEFHEYMTTGPGRFANASQIALVQSFFTYSIPADLLGTSKEFSLSEAINFFGWGEQINDYTLSQNHELSQSDFKAEGGQEWAERAYVFQSQSYALNKNVKFYIDEYGNKFIKNFALMLHEEDFDFTSSSLGTQIGNFLIGDDIDPLEIGKTIKFVYPTSAGNYHEEYGSTYNLEQFNNDLARYNQQNHGTYAELKAPMYDLVEKLWDSGITKFVDSQGRAIVYGTNVSDSIDASPNLLNLPSNPFPINSKMYIYYNNNFHKGIALIGGDGSDTLVGSNFNDLLIGGYAIDKVDDRGDYLEGGSGDDWYFSGNFDTIKDDDEGEGRVYFEGFKLTGGVLTGVSGSTRIYRGDGGTYRLNGDLLTFAKDGKILTIENYHKEAKDLEINLRDTGEIKIFINDKSEYERMERMNFTVSIQSDFPLDEPLTVYTSIGDVTIPVGKNSGILTYTWANDYVRECRNEVFTVSITGTDYDGEMTVIHTDTGIGTIKDDDPEGDCPQPVNFRDQRKAA